MNSGQAKHITRVFVPIMKSASHVGISKLMEVYSCEKTSAFVRSSSYAYSCTLPNHCSPLRHPSVKRGRNFDILSIYQLARIRRSIEPIDKYQIITQMTAWIWVFGVKLVTAGSKWPHSPTLIWVITRDLANECSGSIWSKHSNYEGLNCLSVPTSSVIYIKAGFKFVQVPEWSALYTFITVGFVYFLTVDCIHNTELRLALEMFCRNLFPICMHRWGTQGTNKCLHLRTHTHTYIYIYIWHA